MTMIQDLDFKTLTLMDALDLAVLIEEEARGRYEEFADQMDAHFSPGASKFFRSMVRNETKHRDWLAQRRRQLFGDEPTRVSPALIVEGEAPPHEATEVFMSRRGALLVALRAETKARDFFAAALQHVQDAEVRALFDELHEEEVEHMRLVNLELAKLPDKPEGDPASTADEPVAQ
jgi:rubrerythrin